MRIYTAISLIFKSLLIIIAISIIVLIYLKAFSVISFELPKETIVLTFVGILATFIILNNHSQVDEVKDKFDSFSKQIQSQNDVVTSMLSSTEPILDRIAKDIINKGYSVIEAFQMRKVEEDYNFYKIKVEITIKGNTILCKNVDTGEIIDNISIETKGGIYTLNTTKLYKIYMFYRG